MMKRRSTAEICAQNIFSRHKLLKEALENPAQASPKIFQACDSQSALANMSQPSLGITALSRNSLYKYTDLVLTDQRIPNGFKDEGSVGYRYLDWLRNEVKKIGKEALFERTKSAREQRFKQKFEDASAQTDELRKHSLAVSKAYLHLFVSLKGLHADESVSSITRQRIANLMNDHDRLYSDLFQEIGTLRPGNLESL